MTDTSTNSDFICELIEAAHPIDEPSADHAYLLDQAAYRIRKMELDVIRLDWLSDRSNHIGNVQLPRECVERNIDSLRSAIDDAMSLDEDKGCDAG